MSNHDAAPKKSIVKSLITAIVVLAVLVAILAAYGLFSLPVWPFIFMLLYQFKIIHLDSSKYWPTTIGGAVGLLAGYAMPLLGLVIENEMVVMGVFLAIIVLIVTLDLHESLPFVVNLFLLVVMNILLNVHGTNAIETFYPTVLSYLVSAVIFGLIIGIAQSLKKRGESHAK